MLRRTSFLAIAAAVVALFSAQQASAQARIYVGGGATIPTGDFKDYAKTGWQAFGGLLYPIGPPGLAVGAEGFYGQNSHETADEKTNPYGGMAIVNYGFQMDGEFTPFVFGGAGVLVHRFSGSAGETASETQFGAQGGAGVKYAVSPQVGVFIGGKYVYSKDTQFIAAGAGVSFMIGGI